MTKSTPAWYSATRSEFLQRAHDEVVGLLASRATSQGWHVEAEQQQEWTASVQILQSRLGDLTREGMMLLREALGRTELSEYQHIILEYDLRRRGLRLDCVLIAPGAIVVLEFKRSRFQQADRDQVVDYCVNLVEFHEKTRRWTEAGGAVIVPVLCATGGRVRYSSPPRGLRLRSPWEQVVGGVIQSGASDLGRALLEALERRTARTPMDGREWVTSAFSPSSTILDAAISLYGQHDVSAISTHEAPAAHIEECTREIAGQIERALARGERLVILMTGAPGAGKTLVGLNLVFDERFREDAVFVTGNAPLVDVLKRALSNSYKAARASGTLRIPSGYALEQAKQVVDMALFKIVKAHQFLGKHGGSTHASDGRIVVFDEAQRTYEKGKQVAGAKLEEDEAVLILRALTASYSGASIVVALLGENQAINRKESGGIAWLHAARTVGWSVAAGAETLRRIGAGPRDLDGVLTRPMLHGHLSHSMRFYRNMGLEQWVDAVMQGDAERARAIARDLEQEGHPVRITRSLDGARDWVRTQRVGSERAGIIASAQARRLIADGLYVGMKPDIANWMLAPSGDVRSSNMLETVQNQYQIQGLELDYALVCWGADLRWTDGRWSAHRIHGGGWIRDNSLDVAKNGYRVLLTRARKGMIVYVPRGDIAGIDETRRARFYDHTHAFLVECGGLIDRE